MWSDVFAGDNARMKGTDTMTTDDMMNAARENLAQYRAAKKSGKLAAKYGDAEGVTYWAESAKKWLNGVTNWVALAAKMD